MVDPTGIIKLVAGPIFRLASGEVAKRADYIVNYKDKLQRLSDLYEELEVWQKDVQKFVEEDKMKYKVPSKSVQKWLSDTEKFMLDLKNDDVLLMDDAERKRIGNSLLGLGNPKKLHNFGQMAQNKADQIDRLLKRVCKLRFNQFTYSSGPTSLKMFEGKFHVELESRLKILKKIMHVLKSNVNKVNRIIGVFGVGGTGKTTLVEEMACLAKRENLFIKVIKVEISKSPNIKLIQDGIANEIGLDLNHIQSEKERASKLTKSLKKMRKQTSNNISDDEQRSNNNREHNLLIILDNLWNQFELQDLGISYELQMDIDCKIIVVSRNKDVCQQMGASDFIYEVGDLNDSEAKLLFEEKLGQNMAKTEEYKVIMENVLKKCSRLPLSISVIADRLRNQNLNVWKHFVQQLDKSNSSKTEDILCYTYSVVKVSYNFIYSKEQKMFFLLCCIFHHDERILFWNLLYYGIGLGLFQNIISLVMAIHQAREWVENLISLSLLRAFDTNSGEIKIHDDIREAGILIAKKGKQPFHIGDCSSWMLEDTFKKHSIISMSSSNNCKYLSGLHLPRLQLLRLCKTSISDPHGNYFKRMHNIKVLDLSGSTIQNFSLAEDTMRSLRTLVLDDCSSLINISQLCKLVKLQVLSLKRSNIKQLPEEIGDLRNLKLLYLTSSSKLKKIPAGALAKFCHLEGLFMKDSFKDWESEKDDHFKDCQSVEGMTSISELKSLSLKVLEVDVRSIKHLPDEDIFQNLSIFGIRIGERFEEMYFDFGWESVDTSSIHDILFSSRLYIVGGNESDLKRKKGLVALMKKAETLWLENIDGLTKIVSASNGYRLRNLKALTIFRCKEMKCVVEENETSDPNKSSDQGGMYDIFPNLEDLTLCQLPELQSYVFPAQIARKLKVIRVVDCGKLKSIFFASSGYMKMQKDEGSENNEIEFPSLQKLVMKRLNLLEGFCCDTEDASDTSQLLFGKKIKLPHLEALLLDNINKIRHVRGDYEEIGKDNCDVPNLKVLKISGCESIESLCSISWILGLQYLYIYGCPKMTQVISSKIGGEDEIIQDGPMSFSNLSDLELRDIKNLTCFYQGSLKLDFPSLEKLSLQDLQKIESFAKYEHSKNAKEEDNAGENTLFSSKKLSFPSLAKLNINQLDNIEMLWDKASLEELPRLNEIEMLQMPKLRRISSEVSDQNGLVGRLKRIYLRSCKAIESLISELPPPQSHSPNVDFVFTNLQQLELSNQEYFKCICQESLSVNFKFLNELDLGNLHLDDVPDEEEKSSNQMGEEIEGRQGNGRSMVNISHFFEKVEFPSLQTLKLYNSFIRLEYLPSTILQNLTSLVLFNLDMRCLFPTKSILLELQKLEELYVQSCKSLEDFFGGVDDEEDHEYGAAERLQLSSLRILHLFNLPKLTLQLPVQIFPGLQELIIFICKKFHIPVYTTNGATSGGHVTLLPNLHKLVIEYCHGVEAIFGGKEETLEAEDDEEENDDDDRERVCTATEVVVQYVIEFPLLESIEIYDMCFLRTFFDTSAGGSRSSYDLQLPSLQSVKIKKCFNMESFSSRTPIAPNLASIEIDGEQIDVEDCAGDLNSAVQCLFNKRQKVVSGWPKKLKYGKHDQHELTLVIYTIHFYCGACSRTFWIGEFGFGCVATFGFGCVACGYFICGRCGLESMLESDGKDQPEEVPNEIKVAMRLPKTLNLELHLHELKLHAVIKEVPKSFNADSNKLRIFQLLGLLDGKLKKDYCNRCKGEISDLFAYSCEDRKCKFSLHPKCALEEEHQVTEKSSGVVEGPSDSVAPQPVEVESPELSPLPVSEFTDSCSSTVLTSPSEILAQSSQFIEATQEIVSKVPLTTTNELNAKITAAEQVFQSWRNTSIAARQHIILKLQELIMKDLDKIAFKITVEQEKFLKDTLGELYRGIEMVGHVSEMSSFQREEIVLSGSREPLGACVEICTANLPSTVLLWMFLVAFTRGDTFVLKSSLKSPAEGGISRDTPNMAALRSKHSKEDGRTCKLWVELASEKREVAIGKIPNDILGFDSTPMLWPEDNVTVILQSIITGCENFELPIQLPNMQYVKDALNINTVAERIYVQWPASLVTFDTRESFVGLKKKVKGKRIEVDPEMIVKKPTGVYPLIDENIIGCLTNNTEELHFYLSKYLPENCSFAIKLPNSIFLFGEDRETWMLRDDFIHFFKYKCLNISIIHIFLLYAMDKCGEYGFGHISCLCPEAISKSRMSVVSTREQCFTYLSNGVETCLKLDKRLIFLAYHESYHWRLLVVCLPKNTVYVFDPANDKNIKNIYISRSLNVIFKNLLKVKLNWSFVECPKQPGNTECGYYIMHYMEDIINKFAQSYDLEKDYKGPSTLTYEELDEIRDKWSRYFIDEMLIN